MEIVQRNCVGTSSLREQQRLNKKSKGMRLCDASVTGRRCQKKKVIFRSHISHADVRMTLFLVAAADELSSECEQNDQKLCPQKSRRAQVHADINSDYRHSNNSRLNEWFHATKVDT